MLKTDAIKRALERLFPKLITAALVALVLWKTNPSHVRHEAKLYPGRLFGNSQPVARRMPEDSQWAELLISGPKTTWHNHTFFSTTTNNKSGARGSVGILGFVFDLRTERQKETERLDYVHAQGVAAVKAFEQNIANSFGWRQR